MDIHFKASQNKPIRITTDHLEIDTHRVNINDALNLEEPVGTVAAQSVVQAMDEFVRLTSSHCNPQFAALVFNATNNFRALDWYFPITNMLTAPELDSFYGLVQRIAAHPNFDLRLIGENKSDLTDRMPSSVRHLVAGQLAEVFFYKQNILERFLSTPRHFQLYATPRAFEQDGGVSGGDYHPGHESIQLVLSRLFEGFNGETAGVCPFLHELCHMLDHFDVGSGRMGQVEGLLPGASPRDGEAFNPIARKLFITGKSLELERYLAVYEGRFKEGDLLPIGHPYVFQNNGEFIAGYFEMFFRNPNYFAENNPDLYSAFMELFGYDPRGAWQQDFPHYVNQNRNFYLSGRKPGKPGLTLPKDEALTIYTLEEGTVYIVTQPFKDHYGNEFSAGDKLTFVGRNFIPYHGGHTITFKEKTLYLQEEDNRDVVDTFGDYFQVFDPSGRVRKPQPPAPRKKNERWEAFLSFWAYLLFATLGIWIVFFSNEQNLVVVIAGWFGIVFFGFGAVLSIRTMLKRKDK
jgi:hypothetical protein